MEKLFAFLTFINLAIAFILSKKERQGRERVNILRNRINELKKDQNIAFAREAKEHEQEIITIENRRKGFDNVIIFLDVLGVITAGITLILIFKN